MREFVPASLVCEGYITHNGDLDAFEIHGITYPLESVRELGEPWLAKSDINRLG